MATPVWFVQEGARLLIVTDGASGKVKRLRHNPAVRVALCTASGRLRSRLVAGTAEVLPESGVKAAERLMARKYRLDLLVHPAAACRPVGAASGPSAAPFGRAGRHRRRGRSSLPEEDRRLEVGDPLLLAVERDLAELVDDRGRRRVHEPVEAAAA